MKIAVVHPYPVFEGAVGGVTRINSLVRFLAPRHQLTVFAHSSGDPETDEAAIADLQRIGVEQRLFSLPGRNLLRRVSWVFNRTPYYVEYNRNPELEAALVEHEARQGLDLIHLEFAYMAPLLSDISSRAVRILAEQETMPLVIERLRRVPLRRRSLWETFLVAQASRVEIFESAALSTFDRLYAISPEEAESMAALSGREVDILPHMVNTRSFTPGHRPGKEPKVLFVGNYRHRPNLHGLLWFVREVWPSVRAANPQAIFEVVGPGLNDDQRRDIESESIRVLGRVEDLAERYRQASVFVNPILSGGGMRGKVLEAFASGLPVVSTAMGMDGIAASAEAHSMQADDPGGFAECVVRYLDDERLRIEHGNSARQLTETTYDTRVVCARLERDYRECLAVHRNGAA